MQPRTGDDVVDALLAAAHRVRTATDRRLRELGLSLTRLKALRALAAASDPVSLTRLSEHLGLAARSVTDLAGDLERAGLAVRTSHPSDRRVSLIAITPAGSDALAAASDAAAEVASRFTAELSGDERATLLSLLSQLGRLGADDQPSASAARSPSASNRVT